MCRVSQVLQVSRVQRVLSPVRAREVTLVHAVSLDHPEVTANAAYPGQLVQLVCKDWTYVCCVTRGCRHDALR